MNCFAYWILKTISNVKQEEKSKETYILKHIDYYFK